MVGNRRKRRRRYSGVMTDCAVDMCSYLFHFASGFLFGEEYTDLGVQAIRRENVIYYKCFQIFVPQNWPKICVCILLLSIISVHHHPFLFYSHHDRNRWIQYSQMMTCKFLYSICIYNNFFKALCVFKTQASKKDSSQSILNYFPAKSIFSILKRSKQTPTKSKSVGWR